MSFIKKASKALSSVQGPLGDFGGDMICQPVFLARSQGRGEGALCRRRKWYPAAWGERWQCMYRIRGNNPTGNSNTPPPPTDELRLWEGLENCILENAGTGGRAVASWQGNCRRGIDLRNRGMIKSHHLPPPGLLASPTPPPQLIPLLLRFCGLAVGWGEGRGTIDELAALLWS